MVDQKISALTEQAVLQDNDLIVIAEDVGAGSFDSKKTKASDARTYFSGVSGPISINMLTEEPVAVGQGTWARAQNSTFIYAGYFQNTSNADGDEFDIEVKVPETGTYQLRFKLIKSANAGIVDVDVDSVEVGSVDLYAASADHLFVAEITGISIAAGTRTITFRLDGKNASSSDFFTNFSGIVLRRTA